MIAELCKAGPRRARLLQALGRRAFASQSEAERQLEQKIASQLKTQSVTVKDTSGGCGTMYNIDVVAEEFRGLSIVKQHRLVAGVLKDDIAQWHGFTLQTKAPP